MSKYRCSLCGKVIERDSDKQWIRSYCEETKKLTRILKLKEESH